MIETALSKAAARWCCLLLAVAPALAQIKLRLDVSEKRVHIERDSGALCRRGALEESERSADQISLCGYCLHSSALAQASAVAAKARVIVFNDRSGCSSNSAPIKRAECAARRTA